jgi:hypothetical protein
MAEILHVLQVWIQEAHKLDQRHSIALAFFFILNRQEVFHHFLYMATIFPHG